MKKITLIVFVSLICFAGKAQTAMTNPNGSAIDTATQAATEGPKLQVKGTAKTVSIVLLFTKISGTVAGEVRWQGSNDDVTYATIESDTLTDATNAYTYKETDKGYLYYKALIYQSGTSSGSYSAVLYTTK